MEYPKHLLPKPHFKIINCPDELKKQYLIHFTPDKDLIDPVTKKLRVSYVVKRTGHLRDYSNNLLGVFLVDDIYWSVQDSPSKDYFIGSWEIGSSVKAPKVPEEVLREEVKGYFFLKVAHFQNKEIKFHDNLFPNPECRVLHTPTNSNFWHFSLRWFFNGEDIEWTKGIEKRMKQHVSKSLIIEKAIFEEPFYEELETDCYTT